MPEYLPIAELTTIENDVTVTAGKKIDGIDLSAHAHNTTDGSTKVSINDLDNVNLVVPAVDQILKFNGVNWVNSAGLVASAGRGTIFYYDSTASDVTSNETLSRIPNVITEYDESQTVNNSIELIDSYASSVSGLGITQINAGIWTFNTYTYISAVDGITKLRYIVHKIDNATPWAETELFSIDSEELTTVGIATTDAVVYTTTTIQPAFSITETQRLKVEVWASTDNVGDIIVHLVHSGPYTSSIETPLPTKHNDLAGLEGGNGEFYHLTLTDYTGTGTGVMVRKNSSTSTGNTIVDRIGIGATPTTTYKFIVHNGHSKYEQVAAPTTSPTVALGAAGLLTGDYYYRISYVTAIGETEAGPVSSLIQPSSQKVELSNIPVSLDIDVTSRKIYRTVAGGSIYRMQLLTTINDNTTTLFSDNILDNALSADLDRQINTTGGLTYTDGHLAGTTGVNSTSYGYDSFSNGTGYNCSSFGVGCLETNTFGSNNVAYGFKVLNANTTGSNNTGVGINALLTNITGDYNTGVGGNALKLNTTGSNNIAIGSDALFNNIDGTHNTSVGQQTLQNNISGSDNNAFGSGALNHVTTGTFNIGMGTDAGRYITTGDYNIAVGYRATLGTLASGITGNYNIGIGVGNLAVLVDGSSNIAIGTNTLNANISGIGNIGIGGALVLYNCTNSQNVAIGNQAGSQIINGDHNTFLGNLAGNSDQQKVDATNSMALGNGAYTTASNQIVLGNTNITDVVINGAISSPTLITPTISSFINATHTHAAAGATGGVIDHANLTNKGTHTHVQIDTAIDTTLPGLVTTHAALNTGTHGIGASIIASIANIATHAALTTTHGVSGTIVGTTDTQVLSNKIITYTAGTAIAGTAPIKLTAGTLLTTSEAGTFEFDGDCHYTTTSVGRGVIPSMKLAIIQTPYTLTTLSAQNCFPAANDVLTIAANTTYLLEGLYMLSDTGNATYSTMGFVLGGGATLSDIHYSARATGGIAVNSFATTTAISFITTNAETQIMARPAAGYRVIAFKGEVRVNVGGTIAPQLGYEAGRTLGTPAMQLGSFISLTPIGNGSVSSVGPWA